MRRYCPCGNPCTDDSGRPPPCFYCGGALCETCCDARRAREPAQHFAPPPQQLLPIDPPPAEWIDLRDAIAREYTSALFASLLLPASAYEPVVLVRRADLERPAKTPPPPPPAAPF